MKILLTAGGAIAVLTIAVPATAQTATFVPGGSSPSNGFTVINTFDTSAGLTGSFYQIKKPPADSKGSPPANSSPSGTSYLAVLGGGSATYDLSAFLPQAIQFDWGSVDHFNTLTVKTLAGGYTYIPGAASFPNPANGNKTGAATNGLFTVSFADTRITAVKFASSTNSFEVDNFAIFGGVPEPTTWALMIIGFGAVGGSMRRRNGVRANVSFV